MHSKEELFGSDFLKQFKTQEELTSFLKELYAKGLEKILEGEMDSHLGYEKHDQKGHHTGNSRNGKTKKKLRSEFGQVDVQVPRDRNSQFEPVVLPKRSRSTPGIDQLVVSLYAKGMSVRDIEEQLREIYGFNISESTISNITAQVLESIQEWQQRPLERLYYIVWMDGIVFKVRQQGKVINKTLYLAIGLNHSGRKELLGLWVGEKESAAYWMTVLTDLKARGVEDILITSTDNLNGFTEAINSVFPQAVTQICVVHQIRNASRYVVWKDKKAFAKAMKAVYTAPTREVAAQALEEMDQAWGHKYPYAIKSWQSNWEKLTAFFDFPVEIRHIIYTTNIIENLNGKIRKYTKNKLSFPDDQAVKKSVFLALNEITKKWTQPVRNWALILNQFSIIFKERCEL